MKRVKDVWALCPGGRTLPEIKYIVQYVDFCPIFAQGFGTHSLGAIAPQAVMRGQPRAVIKTIVTGRAVQ